MLFIAFAPPPPDAENPSYIIACLIFQGSDNLRKLLSGVLLSEMPLSLQVYKNCIRLKTIYHEMLILISLNHVLSALIGWASG